MGRAEKGEDGITLAIEPSDVMKTEFMKEGVRRHENPSNSADSIKKTLKQFVLTPKLDDGTDRSDEKFYIIGNEEFEVRPLKVEYLKDRVHLFCSNSKLAS